jgi:hypothetical protein
MSKFWFAGGYYIDLDEYGQLRIAGPGNHLFCGLTLPKPFGISKMKQTNNKLRLHLSFQEQEIVVHQPVMGDIRSVRTVTEVPNVARPTFAEMQKTYPGQFMPTETVIKHTGNLKLVFTRKFSGYRYGFEMDFPKQATVSQESGVYRITSPGAVNLILTCFFDFPSDKLKIRRLVSNGLIQNSLSLLPEALQNLVERTEEEIEHLISYSKTSSYEYGTVFPRDWMESAELGVGDLSPSTIEEMYGQALKNVSPEGEGWHEDVIGEAAERFSVEGLDIIDRRMIDIEPRYLLGLGKLSQKFLHKPANIDKLRLIAKYVVTQARNSNLITFKDPIVGNWRDSPSAFNGAQGPIAPFDVNAVFYPAALEKIVQFQDMLHIEDPDILQLMEKWQKVHHLYAFTDPLGQNGYALCLYGNSPTPLRVHHTDEAYFFLYGWPSRAECVSFATRLINPEYFHTDSGPIIVGKNQGYSSRQYHGEVIWPKQTALVVAGLRRQLDRAFYEEWPIEDIHRIRVALSETAKKSIRAFVELDSVPELYIDVDGKAVRYDSQTVRDGQVSYIQLWSAVGFRRILRDLIYISLKYDQPLEFLP